jgi:hypothetical protein
VKISFSPASLEGQARVTNGKTDACYENQNGLEGKEESFVSCKATANTLAELSYSVSSANKDAECGNGKS